MSAEPVEAIFARVENRFDRAERAFQQFLISTGRAKLEALEDFLVYGRSVTNVMENLRGHIHSFDSWYKPHSAAMSKDSGLRRFYLMRSEILKRGSLSVDRAVIIAHPTQGSFPGQAPAGATHFINHDEATEKWGWLVKHPDGSIEKLLFDYPEDVIRADWVNFTPPIANSLEDEVSATALRYVNYLRRMLDELRVLVIRQGT